MQDNLTLRASQMRNVGVGDKLPVRQNRASAGAVGEGHDVRVEVGVCRQVWT